MTVIAPSIRVETCAKGINSIRPAAVKIAMSPMPPSPLRQPLTIDRVQAKSTMGWMTCTATERIVLLPENRA